MGRARHRGCFCRRRSPARSVCMELGGHSAENQDNPYMGSVEAPSSFTATLQDHQVIHFPGIAGLYRPRMRRKRGNPQLEVDTDKWTLGRNTTRPMQSFSGDGTAIARSLPAFKPTPDSFQVSREVGVATRPPIAMQFSRVHLPGSNDRRGGVCIGRSLRGQM